MLLNLMLTTSPLRGDLDRGKVREREDDRRVLLDVRAKRGDGGAVRQGLTEKRTDLKGRRVIDGEVWRQLGDF